MNFQVEPIIEEAREEEENLSPQRKESVVIEELLDDISEGNEKKLKENGSNMDCYNREKKERVHSDIASRDMIERCKKGDLPKLPQQKGSVIMEELLDDISEGEKKYEDKIRKESNLNEETINIAPSPKPLLSGTKLDISVSKQRNVSKEESRNIKIMENSSDVELSKEGVVDEDNSDKGKEKGKGEVSEDRMDKVNVIAVETLIGEIDSVRVFGNHQDICQKLPGDAELLSRNSSKEDFGFPETDIIHTEADIATRDTIERCKKGEAVEEGLLVERKSLKFGAENLKSCDKGDMGEKMFEEEELVVRKILKEYGDEEEENSEQALLGFERQVVATETNLSFFCPLSLKGKSEVSFCWLLNPSVNIKL